MTDSRFQYWARGFRAVVEQYFDGAITANELARYAMTSINVDGYTYSRFYRLRVWLAWKILPTI